MFQHLRRTKRETKDSLQCSCRCSARRPRGKEICCTRKQAQTSLWSLKNRFCELCQSFAFDLATRFHILTCSSLSLTLRSLSGYHMDLFSSSNKHPRFVVCLQQHLSQSSQNSTPCVHVLLIWIQKCRACLTAKQRQKARTNPINSIEVNRPMQILSVVSAGLTGSFSLLFECLNAGSLVLHSGFDSRIYFHVAILNWVTSSWNVFFCRSRHCRDSRRSNIFCFVSVANFSVPRRRLCRSLLSATSQHL